MSAQARPTSKPMSQQFADNYDKIFNKCKGEGLCEDPGCPAHYADTPIGEDTRPKDRVKLGLSPSTVVEDIDARG